jgi:quercetin dioxygenase-like cupin family protein
MKVRHYSQTEPHTEAPGVAMRTVIGRNEGAPRFAMRVFEVSPGASTPKHTHDWEHEVFVFEGEGILHTINGGQKLKPGDVVYVAPSDLHCFENIGASALRFVCCIPLEPA